MNTSDDNVSTQKNNCKKVIAQESSYKPGVKVIRGRGRGGISRATTSSIASSVRQFLKLTKLIVSNLECGLTDTDMMNLFGEFRSLKSAGVHYDESDGSPGHADILFKTHTDAIEAMNKYNGVSLNGRKISIQLSIFDHTFKKFSFSLMGSNKSTIERTTGQKKNKRKDSLRLKRTSQSLDGMLSNLQIA